MMRWPWRAAAGRSDGRLPSPPARLQPGQGFTEGLVSDIESRRHTLIDDPVVDPWLAAVDPPVARDDGHIDTSIARLLEAGSRWDALAALLDPPSADVLRAVLLMRALGSTHYHYPWARREHLTENYRLAQEAIVGPGESHPIPPFPSPEFAVHYAGETIRLEAWLGSVVASYVLDQYAHPHACVRLGDIVIEAGGGQGDTTLALAARVGPHGHVVCAEPSPSNLPALCWNLALNPALAARVSLTERALRDLPGEQVSLSRAGAASVAAAGGTHAAAAGGTHAAAGGGTNDIVESDTIDSLVEGGDVARVDFIKINLHGSEAAALAGAHTTIAQFRPRLALAASHRPDDLLDLSEYLTGIDPDYQLRLRHVTLGLSGTVMYAV